MRISRAFLRIGIDARFVGPEGTGLGKYTEQLIENLSQIDHRNHYFIFLKKSNWDYLKLGKNFKKTLADVPWYSIEEQFKMPKIFASQKLDLLHVPHFNVPILYRGRFVATIHDLIHHHFSEYAATTQNPIVFKIKRFAYRRIIASAIKKSQKILAPSNFVKDEIVQNFKVDNSKIVVTYEAAEEEYFTKTPNSKLQTPNLLKKYKIQSPYIIYVGNAYPHKNLERLLDAFKILTSNDQLLTTNLIIVCPRDIFSERLRNEVAKRDLGRQVVLTGYLEPKDLKLLFSDAEAYVFPSLSEGFGIPGLNAMASKIPVVCSEIPTLKEIYQDAALYFDPESPNDIAGKIKKVLEGTKTRSLLVAKGEKLVKKYSWQNMARETLDVYQSAVE